MSAEQGFAAPQPGPPGRAAAAAAGPSAGQAGRAAAAVPPRAGHGRAPGGAGRPRHAGRRAAAGPGAEQRRLQAGHAWLGRPSARGAGPRPGRAGSRPRRDPGRRAQAETLRQLVERADAKARTSRPAASKRGEDEIASQVGGGGAQGAPNDSAFGVPAGGGRLPPGKSQPWNPWGENPSWPLVSIPPRPPPAWPRLHGAGAGAAGRPIQGGPVGVDRTDPAAERAQHLQDRAGRAVVQAGAERHAVQRHAQRHVLHDGHGGPLGCAADQHAAVRRAARDHEPGRLPGPPGGAPARGSMSIQLANGTSF
ncbi:hypothetical protein Ddc_24901 [Ditylenchus destructor]|nr:hypothetical protein Ddc_24901 [Ditylenchus destructor]